MSDLYGADVVAWAGQQADSLRRQRNRLDNVTEEIEDVVRRDHDRIEGALRSAAVHLLKWQFQPEMRSNSWRRSVVDARLRVAWMVKRHPTLRSCTAAVLADTFAGVRLIRCADQLQPRSGPADAGHDPPRWRPPPRGRDCGATGARQGMNRSLRRRHLS